MFLETLCRYLLTYRDAWEELGFATAELNDKGENAADYDSSTIEWEIIEDYAEYLFGLLIFDGAKVISGKPFRTIEDFERQLTLTAAAFVGWLPPLGAGRSIAEEADLLFDRITRTRMTFYEETGLSQGPDWENVLQRKALRIHARTNSRRLWREEVDRILAADAPKGGEP